MAYPSKTELPACKHGVPYCKGADRASEPGGIACNRCQRDRIIALEAEVRRMERERDALRARLEAAEPVLREVPK